MIKNAAKEGKTGKAGKTGETASASAPLLAAWLKTPLGRMLAAGRGEFLEWLIFCDSGGGRDRRALKGWLGPGFKLGENQALASIRGELADYFAGKLKKFSTRLAFSGTPFQTQVWKELIRIPYGKTISYSELARRAGRPTAFRAAAQANACNRLAVIVPCHRVINKDGALGGYASGIERKQWLLDLERGQAAPATGRRNAAWKN